MAHQRSSYISNVFFHGVRLSVRFIVAPVYMYLHICVPRDSARPHQSVGGKAVLYIFEKSLFLQKTWQRNVCRPAWCQQLPFIPRWPAMMRVTGAIFLCASAVTRRDDTLLVYPSRFHSSPRSQARSCSFNFHEK